MWNKQRLTLSRSVIKPQFNSHNNHHPHVMGNGGIPSPMNAPAKFTCKYEVQIENEKDFQVARKIIGPKGCNMKNIIEYCQSYMKNSDQNSLSDLLKLRLRGRGSGFKEGPGQKESNEPMHLCISSKYKEVYQIACKLVEELLLNLYKEYTEFAQRKGFKLYSPLKIKQIEAYNGPNTENGGDIFNFNPRHNSEDLSLEEQFSKALDLKNERNIRVPQRKGSFDSSRVLRPRQMNGAHFSEKYVNNVFYQ